MCGKQLLLFPLPPRRGAGVGRAHGLKKAPEIRRLCFPIYGTFSFLLDRIDESAGSYYNVRKDLKRGGSMDNLPGDPMILLSFVNTQLRDNYDSLDSFCKNYGVSQQDIRARLAAIDYEYDKNLNRFC